MQSSMFLPFEGGHMILDTLFAEQFELIGRTIYPSRPEFCVEMYEVKYIID